MIKKILLFFFLLFALLSCNEERDRSDDTTWIGGQIVNPKLDYILFAKGKDILDTVKLDSNNFFLYKTNKMEEGLYTLRHMETQVFYIIPGDSLLLHLNTADFDESLAYSGKGGEKNSLLMDLYLKNERENKLLPKWYTLSPEDYLVKIDSLKAVKQREYQEFLGKHDVSSGFKDVAESSIKYDYFSKKEMYAMANRSRSEIMDDNFFDHRKDIDFNKEPLRFYYPYYRFLDRYFNSLIIAQHPPGVDRNSYDFSVEKMKAIDSIVKNDSIKNSLLQVTALRYLFCAKEPVEEKQFFDLFSSINTNKKHLNEIERLTEATIKLSKGNPLPDIEIISMDNVLTTIQKLITKPTVLYFWTGDSPSQAKTVHTRAAELKSKYPEYNFYAINTDNHFKKWRKMVKKLGFDPNSEFQFNNVAEAQKELVLSSVSKSIILDKDAVILDGNTNMFNSNFEELLLGFLNR